LARALIFKPDLLLLDEPMSALDKKLRIDLQDELREIHRTLGTTFINVTHDQEEAMHMSDRIAVMNHGRIEQFDTSFNLYRCPNSRFVAEFIGKSNIFSGTVTLQGDACVFRSERIAIPLTKRLAGQGDAMIMVRPEDASIEIAPPSDQRIHLPARVQNSTYSGDRVFYTLALETGGTFLAYGKARSGIHADGEPVYASFTAEDCIVLSKAD
jgi:ABC-type Fe3+/spermidine/putrescine transport system ATPase subunit